jgi:hypothetical protein
MTPPVKPEQGGWWDEFVHNLVAPLDGMGGLGDALGGPRVELSGLPKWLEDGLVGYGNKVAGNVKRDYIDPLKTPEGQMQFLQDQIGFGTLGAVGKAGGHKAAKKVLEKLRAAAVRSDDGRIFEGTAHPFAFADGEDAGAVFSGHPDNEGFIHPTKGYITRRQAKEMGYFGKSEKDIDQTVQVKDEHEIVDDLPADLDAQIAAIAAKHAEPDAAAIPKSPKVRVRSALDKLLRGQGTGKLAKELAARPQGFTYDPRTGTFHQGAGFAVANPPGGKSLVFEGPITGTALREFLAKNKKVLGKDGMNIGGWYNEKDGKFYLDVSEVVGDRDRALQLAHKRNEQAVFDLEKLENIDNPHYRDPKEVGERLNVLDWTPERLEEYGALHGTKGLGRVSPEHKIKMSDGREVNVPGGFEGDFSYYDLLTLKAQGINPNLLPEGMHEKIHQKMMRSMTNNDMSDEEMFRALAFGITSPNSPLTPNEFTVSRIMPQSMADIKKLAKADPVTLARELEVDAAKYGGLGTSGSVDYANVVKLAQLFEKNPKWFRRKGDEAWDQYVDRISSQIPGLGTKTASLGGVWQDLPGANVSAVDRHMTELAMPHILEHPELGPDFRARAVKSWNNRKDVDGPPVTSLEEIRERDPVWARDFLASLINSPTHATMRTRKGGYGKNVPEEMRLTDWVEEPEKTTQMNPYYREALKYNQKHKPEGMSLFGSQWMLWDRQRGRIEPHEVMFPGLNRLPRMTRGDSRASMKAHKAAGYSQNRPTEKYPLAAGGQLPAVRAVKNPMDLALWSLGGVTAAGLLNPYGEEESPAEGLW